MQIRAAVLNTMGTSRPYADSRPLTIETLELHEPGDGEVRVAVRAAGLCHSDLSVVNGDRPRPTPMALGHEAAGVVEAVGHGVHDLAPGDHVVMVFVPSCGHCGPCAEGRPALCEPGGAANVAGTLLGGDRRIARADGSTVNHHLGVSAFADHAVVSRRSLVKIDRDVPFEHAALFGCAVLTGVGAAVNTAGVVPGSSVAVVGLGGVGLNALLGALVCGAEPVIAVDALDHKLALARELGARDTFNATDENAVEAIRAATGGGVDYAIELAGSERALELAYQITRRGGTTVTGGLAHPDRHIRLQQAGLVTEERTLKGSYVGSCIPGRDLPRYLRLFRHGRLPVDRLLSGTLPLDDINTALDRLADGEAIRQVIRFD
ncbi:zinc-dependent alcohol dehydrogenase family protein [Arhodomonas sp. AD133]|uniref:zinc-dependent alcohol dehydrogenase family protein n=1 Tax=Arhodomonas sp. AD133 TaxID=3415009 RepID=UPI003EC05617